MINKYVLFLVLGLISTTTWGMEMPEEDQQSLASFIPSTSSSPFPINYGIQETGGVPPLKCLAIDYVSSLLSKGKLLKKFNADRHNFHLAQGFDRLALERLPSELLEPIIGTFINNCDGLKYKLLQNLSIPYAKLKGDHLGKKFVLRKNTALSFSVGRALVWDIFDTTGNSLREITTPADDIITANLNTSATHLLTVSAAGMAGRTLRIWDLQQRECIWQYNNDGQNNFGIGFEGNTLFLLSSSPNQSTIKTWELKNSTMQSFTELTVPLHVESVAIIANEIFLFGNEKVTVADRETGQFLYELISVHGRLTNICGLDSKKDRMITTSSDGTIQIWDRTTNEILTELRGHSGNISFAQFDNTEKNIVSYASDETIRIWNAITGECLFVLYNIESATFYREKNKIGCADDNGIVKIWDVANRTCLKTLGCFPCFPNNVLRQRFPNRCSWLKFANNGNSLIVGIPLYNKVKIFDMRTLYEHEHELEHNTTLDEALKTAYKCKINRFARAARAVQKKAKKAYLGLHRKK